VQVFFDTEAHVDLRVFNDAVTHMGELVNNPLGMKLVQQGLWPGARRYRRNYQSLRTSWKGAVLPGASTVSIVCHRLGLQTNTEVTAHICLGLTHMLTVSQILDWH
jgi:hypothetical protein